MSRVPNLANLSGHNAATLNKSTSGAQVLSLDPTREIFYSPESNVRNQQSKSISLESLVQLRLKMEESGQLQPVRVYKLPANLLDPSKPQMQYGICFGHRRTLACRLTSADDPRIGPKPRQVQATLDPKWLTYPLHKRLLIQHGENGDRENPNFVEQGEVLRKYQELTKEETGKRPSQPELAKVFRISEKTVWALLRAAEFHEHAKAACFGDALSDLDSLIKLDLIAKENDELSAAILEAILEPDAQVNRSLFRDAKIMADSEGYTFDKATWEWPATVLRFIEQNGNQGKQTTPVQQPVQNDTTNTAVGVAQPSAAAGTEPNVPAAPAAPASSVVSAAPADTVKEDESAVTKATNEPVQPLKSGPVLAESTSTVASQSVAASAVEQIKKPILFVEYELNGKKGSGELIVDRLAASPNCGLVSCLQDDGEEAVIEVPVRNIRLISIS